MTEPTSLELVRLEAAHRKALRKYMLTKTRSDATRSWAKVRNIENAIRAALVADIAAFGRVIEILRLIYCAGLPNPVTTTLHNLQIKLAKLREGEKGTRP